MKVYLARTGMHDHPQYLLLKSKTGTQCGQSCQEAPLLQLFQLFSCFAVITEHFVPGACAPQYSCSMSQDCCKAEELAYFQQVATVGHDFAMLQIKMNL